MARLRKKAIPLWWLPRTWRECVRDVLPAVCYLRAIWSAIYYPFQHYLQCPFHYYCNAFQYYLQSFHYYLKSFSLLLARPFNALCNHLIALTLALHSRAILEPRRRALKFQIKVLH